MKTSWSRILLAILSTSVGTGAIAQETIKLGVNQPLTGVVAASGNFVTNGARIAADDINAKGGVLGKKIQLIMTTNTTKPIKNPTTWKPFCVHRKRSFQLESHNTLISPYVVDGIHGIELTPNVLLQTSSRYCPRQCLLLYLENILARTFR